MLPLSVESRHRARPGRTLTKGAPRGTPLLARRGLGDHSIAKGLPRCVGREMACVNPGGHAVHQCVDAPFGRAETRPTDAADGGGKAAQRHSMSALAIGPSSRARHVSGAQAVVYETALRCVHHQTLLRELGLLPCEPGHRCVRKPTPKELDAPARREGRHRSKRTRSQPPMASERCSSSRGAGLSASTNSPTRASPRSCRSSLSAPAANSDKAGIDRRYSDHRLPSEHGAVSITVRLHGKDDDKRKRFKRTENVRAIPPPTSSGSTGEAAMPRASSR
jgi:hypothetical protein